MAAVEGQARRLASLRAAMSPVLPLLEEDSVVEVLLNADGVVWAERVGEGMRRERVRMAPDEALRLLRLVAAEVGQELTAERPTLATKLPLWGARLQASIPPIVEAPVFAMRKPPRVVFGLEDYVARRILTAPQAEALRQAVRGRANILVGGGTGTGKTTLANALLQEVARTGDRVYIVEDTPELQCTAPNRVQVLVQPPTYPWQRAIVDAMRFRPDRIVVGEVRDGSALELLKAWNTGHPGGLATVHANDSAGMLERLCQLVEEVVRPAPRGLIAEAVQVCVHLRRDPAHPAGRSVSAVERVVGLTPAGRWRLEPLAPGLTEGG